jgi:hypothetical protein
MVLKTKFLSLRPVPHTVVIRALFLYPVRDE